ncbi:MAG: UDP-N-acetylmuramate dehydrogenase [Bacillota bacterium]
MLCQSTYHELLKLFPRSEVRFNEPMKLHTSFRIGGPADAFFVPASGEDLKGVLKWCREKGIPVLVLGRGSNLLVRDGGVRGVVVHVGSAFMDFELQEEAKLTAGAGWPLSQLCAKCAALGLSGLEFACGIPGSLGGAVVMNAGAYGGQMSDVVEGVWALDYDANEVFLEGEKLQFRYRGSALQDGRFVVIKALLKLHKADPELISVQMGQLAKARAEKQPLELPSAGSVFKRPPGHFAGRLIEQAGFKGRRIGGAQVSEKHAGFIVNLGGATASDVIRLIGEIQKSVYESTGVLLEPEIKIVGEDPQGGGVCLRAQD